MSDEENIRFAMVESGPAVAPDEVETAERAVEVVVMWGQQVLHVSHLPEDGAFHVGEEGAGGEPDWLVGSEVIGFDRLPIVVAGATLVVPEGATGTVNIGEETRSLAELRGEGKLAAYAEVPRTERYPLPPGAVAQIDYRGFTFLVRPTPAGRRVGVGVAAIMAAVEARPLPYLAGSAALAAILCTIFYFLPPMGAGLAIEDIDSDSRVADYFLASNEVMQEDMPAWVQNQDLAEGGEGERHALDEGQAGDPDEAVTRNRQAVEGPENNPDPHMANRVSTEQIQRAGILGVLQNMSGDWRAPTSEFGREQALGADPMSALGAIMGENIGANFGYHGLGLRGTGRGAGGTGLGTYGLGRLGTMGRGGGRGDGDGYGNGAGGPLGTRRAAVPTLRSGPVDVAGGLSKETIRRVVHRHRNEVRFCYEQQLGNRPDLEGRVTVQFLIRGDGAVSSSFVLPARSNLNDQRVEQCVAGSVRRWAFPQPENGGMVNVAYPFLFTSGG